MPIDSNEASHLPAILRRLRGLAIQNDEAGAISLVRGLSRDDAAQLLNAVGMERWDDERGVVERTPAEQSAMPSLEKFICLHLPMRAHAALLLRAAPSLYGEPPLPNAAARPRTSKEAERMMERRRLRQKALRHPEDDVELVDREKRFIGTIHDHDAEADSSRSIRRSHRVHLDRLLRPDGHSSNEAG